MRLPDLVIGDLVFNPPIIQGGMGVRVSTAPLVSAVSNEGCLGVLASVGLAGDTASNADYEQGSINAFRSEIRATRAQTPKPFGVNIMFALTNYDSLVRTAVEERVNAIISGAGLPMHLPSLVDTPAVKLIPIVSSARATDILFRTWLKRYNRPPDALVVEGAQAGGHLGFKFEDVAVPNPAPVDGILLEVLTLTRTYEAKLGRRIPVIAAGGIFTGADIARVLKLGAGGVQMATRFVCTTECSVSDAYKEAYLNCRPEDIVVIQSPAGMPARVIRNKFVKRIEAGESMKFQCPYRCLKTCAGSAAKYCIADALVNSAAGRMEEGFAMCGTNAARVDRIVPVHDLVAELTRDALAAMA